MRWDLVWIGLGIASALLLTYLFIWPFSPPRSIVVTPDAEHDVLIGVAPFELEDRAFADRGIEEAARQFVEAALPNYAGLKPFTRGNLEAAMSEQNLYFEGIINPGEAIEIGMFTPVRVIVGGNIVDISSEIKEVKKQECQPATESLPRRCNDVIDIKQTISTHAVMQAIDTTTGEIVAGETYKTSSTATYRKGGPVPDLNGRITDTLADIGNKIARKISHHYTREFRYGTFNTIVPKMLGIEGVGLKEVFKSNEMVVLLMHFGRIKRGDVIRVDWIDPDGSLARTDSLKWEGGASSANFSWINRLIPQEEFWQVVVDFLHMLWPGDDVPIYFPLVFNEEPEYGLWKAQLFINDESVLIDTFIVKQRFR